MRFTAFQYAQAIHDLTMGAQQLEPDARNCSICEDSGHMAFECGRNPLLAMLHCENIARQSDDLHTTLHQLAGYNQHMGVQLGPANMRLSSEFSDDPTIGTEFAVKADCFEKKIEEEIDRIFAGLSASIQENFRPADRWALKRAMKICGLTVLPKPTNDLDRAAGDCICECCGEQYRFHPKDWRDTGYLMSPFLHILCDGTRVKL